ncbi:MAG TPA: hypothetical protein VLC48_09990 [Gemmatimonadota bacterium]|nr:hypothetical protein [Gemmatimonadota bacterium]
MRYRATLSATLTAVLVAATVQLGLAQTGQMPKPGTHDAEFLYTHGGQAQTNIQMCSACHAREYCSGCHVNAADVPEIQALRSDPAVAEYTAGLTFPAPASHTPFFFEDHRAAAASATESCAVCHVVEQQCQVCHTGSETLDRPQNTAHRRDVDLYHPFNFMQQHSAAAFNRETDCASCHNPVAFCQDCHANLGRTNQDLRTDTGFHNKNNSFQLGHGQAARQGLESCQTCHTQEYCLQCHSAKLGRRINPHGSGFDAEKLQNKNPAFCGLCHFGNPLEP